MVEAADAKSFLGLHNYDNCNKVSLSADNYWALHVIIGSENSGGFSEQKEKPIVIKLQLVLKFIQSLKGYTVHVCVFFLPVYASVVVVSIKELDLFESLLTGIVTGQIRMHAKKQV